MPPTALTDRERPPPPRRAPMRQPAAFKDRRCVARERPGKVPSGEGDMEAYGIDVAKAEIVVCGPGGTLRVANEEPALRAWLLSLPAGAEILLEPTGRFHRVLERLCQERGLVCRRADPCRVAAYRRALSPRAKTDPGDAALLRRMLLAERDALRPSAAESLEGRDLRDLLALRERLVAQRTALRQGSEESPWTPPALERALGELEGAIRELDAEIARRAAAFEVYGRLLKVDGIGPVTAAALTAVLAGRDFSSPDALVAFLGLDPTVRESGTFRGRRRLSKRGPAFVRRLLFCAGAALSRMAPWRPFFQRQAAKGLSRTEAVLVAARKLVRVVHCMAVTGKPYDRNAARLPA